MIAVSLLIMLILIVLLGTVFIGSRPHIEDFEAFDKIKQGSDKRQNRSVKATENTE